MESSMVEVSYPFAIIWRISEESLKKAAAEDGFIHGKKSKVAFIPDVKYQPYIYPNGLNSLPQDNFFGMSIFTNQTKIEAEFTCAIESANCTFKTGKDKIFLCVEAYCDDLFDPAKKFIVDGYLTLKIEGTLKVQKQREASYVPKDSSLAQCLWNSDDKDFIIEVGGNYIKAHKIVLSTRSPMFAAMMNSLMKEATENRTHITDFSYDVVEAAVKYCYDINIFHSVSASIAKNLLQFADKYQMMGLKDNMEAFLISQINTSNVCQFANCSILSNASKLNQHCFGYLFKFMKKPVVICDIDELDAEFAMKLFKQSFLPTMTS